MRLEPLDDVLPKSLGKNDNQNDVEWIQHSKVKTNLATAAVAKTMPAKENNAYGSCRFK